MKLLLQVPFAVWTILLSLGVGLILWASGITGEGSAILAGIGLELVAIVHRVHLDLRKLADPLRGLPQSHELQETLDSAREIMATKSLQARKLLEATTVTYASRIKDLRYGSMTLLMPEFMEWADDFFKSTGKGDSFNATSVLAGGRYWEETYGKTYERFNRDAGSRGLKIQRIFLLQDENHLEACKAVLDRQLTFSEVWVATFDKQDSTMQPGGRDFFVYNGDVVAGEFHFQGPDRRLTHIQITTDRDEVRKLASEYARLRDRFANRYSPSPGAGEA